MPIPTARAVRRAVDTLARLGPAALAAMIERLDALTPDPEAELDHDGEEDDDANLDGPPVCGLAKCRPVQMVKRKDTSRSPEA